tara:strand:+ start:805 stop:1056 length:252 start_codon:yes stop_codon:yes gene_type:complete
MINSPVRLAIYQMRYVEALASVRYTSYGEDGIVNGVDVVDYGYGEQELLETDTTAAIAMGMDVSMITSQNIKRFPKLAEYTKS